MFNPLVITTLIVQIILSLILIVVVLFQSSNQEGLSGAIAGGAETFFGKNKGRTLDATLKKWTSVVAVLFLVSSILLGIFVQNSMPKTETTVPYTMESAPVTGETPEIEIVPDAGETPDAPEVIENAQD